ncbi:hypothetical protein KM043_011914 [Ampulex compressa]|nr:hypothetical protein KM043_011914 [Ampulex compressa]
MAKDEKRRRNGGTSACRNLTENPAEGRITQTLCVPRLQVRGGSIRHKRYTRHKHHKVRAVGFLYLPRPPGVFHGSNVKRSACISAGSSTKGGFSSWPRNAFRDPLDPE